MSFSVSGGQLPLTAFFDARSIQKRKSTEPKLATTHKGPSESARGAGPSTKRKRQKENLAQRASNPRKSRSGHLSVFRASEDLAEGDSASEPVHPHHKDIHLDKESPSIGPIAPTSLDLPPATPVTYVRSRGTLAATFLPSPPPTVPSAKRARRTPDESKEATGRSPADGRVGYSDCGPSSMHANVTSDSTTAQVVGNKDAIVPLSPQRGRGAATMLPPPLPPKASSSYMPPRPPLRPPRSSSSDRWVPSSQTQELSIPLESQKHADVPHTPAGQMTQIVPSSQSHEREMRISDVLPPMSDIYKTPASPLKRNSSPVSPLLLDSDSDVHPSNSYFTAEHPSPRFVQSSQSQSELDLTSSWAELLGTRQAALARAAQSGTIDLPPSSLPRPAESQDYDAQDEYSQSQDAYSQPSTFASPEPRMSPLCGASQYTDGSSSSSIPPYPQTPSQFRDFLGMFDNRDQFGNELPVSEDGTCHTAGRSRSVSPSPTSRQRARVNGPSRGSSPASHAHGSPHSVQHNLEDGQDTLDVVMESSQSQSYTEYSDSSSASFPHELPTPVRSFLGMFDESQPSQTPFA